MDRNGLEGEESHTDRRATVWRCLSNRERRREKERWSQGHLRVTLAPSAFSSFSSSLAKDHHSPRPLTKMSCVHLGESSQCLHNSLAALLQSIQCKCVSVCWCGECAAEGCTSSDFICAGLHSNIREMCHFFTSLDSFWSCFCL